MPTGKQGFSLLSFGCFLDTYIRYTPCLHLDIDFEGLHYPQDAFLTFSALRTLLSEFEV